ncbi:HTH CENPB-type domain-containing protein [Trichonephila clavipes]|nr:HTH CENPB-type domain-containing protein [Trichonephila clavipes]
MFQLSKDLTCITDLHGGSLVVLGSKLVTRQATIRYLYHSATAASSLLKEKAKAFAKELGIEFSASEGWLTNFKKRNGIVLKKMCGESLSVDINVCSKHCFKKSGFLSPNLVDVDDTLNEFNTEPSLWEALPEQDLKFDNYVLVGMDIAVWGALSDAEIVALYHNKMQKVMKTNRRS